MEKRLYIDSGNGLEPLGYLGELPTAEESEMKFSSIQSEDKDGVVVCQMKLSAETMKSLKAAVRPYLNNNWLKVHGLPMVSRKRYKHQRRRK